jgi:hypothetical protein
VTALMRYRKGGHDQQGLPPGIEVGSPGALRGVAHGFPRSAGHPIVVQVVAQADGVAFADVQ